MSGADNSEQIAFWNGAMAQGWVENEERMDALLQPLSTIALASAAAKRGERVLDIGCGCGATSLAMASIGAQVTGIDVSTPMLASAKRRATLAGLPLELIRADASTYRFAPTFDLLFSRFGVMFFADPVAAFSNLRRALTPQGRLTFICWQLPADNVWMSMPAATIAAVAPPQGPPDPKAMLPFKFADREYVTGVLTAAGFDAPSFENVACDLQIGQNVDEAISFSTRFGPASGALAGLSESLRAVAIERLRAAYREVGGGGPVRLGARCWLVNSANRNASNKNAANR